MTWEAISALGTVLTVVVRAVSAIFALRHVTQLRRATQLDGTMRIFAEFANPEFIAARSFVFCDLAEKLKNETFTDELRSYRMDITKHPNMACFLQLVETLVKNRLVDGNAVYQFAQYSIVKSWEALEPIIRMQRESTNKPLQVGQRRISLHKHEGVAAGRPQTQPR
jgi:hypothetical protein